MSYTRKNRNTLANFFRERSRYFFTSINVRPSQTLPNGIHIPAAIIKPGVTYRKEKANEAV